MRIITHLAVTGGDSIYVQDDRFGLETLVFARKTNGHGQFNVFSQRFKKKKKKEIQIYRTRQRGFVRSLVFR